MMDFVHLICRVYIQIFIIMTHRWQVMMIIQNRRKIFLIVVVIHHWVYHCRRWRALMIDNSVPMRLFIFFVTRLRLQKLLVLTLLRGTSLYYYALCAGVAEENGHFVPVIKIMFDLSALLMSRITLDTTLIAQGHNQFLRTPMFKTRFQLYATQLFSYQYN